MELLGAWPILGRRAVRRPVSVQYDIDMLIRQGAADRSPLVRRAAADGLVQHAGSLTNVRSLMTLFDGEKSPSVRWRIEYLARCQ
jgi:HEAT repeat protein